jgi:group I intron endonuclease
VPVAIYSIKHRATGNEYIGLTAHSLARRFAQHQHAASRCHKLRNALKKYGPDAFHVREEASLPTRHEAAIAERILIAVRKPAFNITPGGEGRVGKRSHSPETRAKISAALTGRKLTNEATRAKLKARKPANKGVPMALDVRAKVSAAKRGVKPSPETVAKRAASNREYWRSDEGRAKARDLAFRRWRCPR